jgi:hypothetical protein
MVAVAVVVAAAMAVQGAAEQGARASLAAACGKWMQLIAFNGLQGAG